MAEIVSSVITIANVSLVIIEKTVGYIRDIKFVNELIEKLLTKLKDLHRVIKVVASTASNCADSGEDSPSLRFVRKTLTTCQKRLDKLKPLVYELASLESETWLQRFAVKRQSDRVKKAMETLIQGINCDMENIKIGVDCLSLSVASANRRISEALAGQQAISIRTEVLHAADQAITPVRRSQSDAGNVPSPDPGLELRRVSTIPPSSRPSVFSSTSSRTTPSPSVRSDSITSMADIAPVNSRSDWEEFHYQLRKCGGDETRIQKIYDILRRHADGCSLATATDTTHRTPLHIAAQRGDVKLAKILVNFRADIDAKDSEHASVLDLAVENNNDTKFVAFLLKLGVNELAILKRNADKFKRMKRTIEFSKKTASERSPTTNI